MSNDLATIGINVVLQGQQETVGGLTQVANTLDNKVSPAAKRVIENFRQTQQMMSRVQTQTQAVNRTFNALDLQRVSQRMGSLENVLNNTRQGMNGFGVITQQAGYQIGDFIVQVQSGTNAFVAFGQQATQMVGFLPNLANELGVARISFLGLSMSMASVTLGLSIIIPLLTAVGAAWMRTSEETSKGAKQQKDAYDQLRESLNEYIKVKEAAAKGVTVDQETATDRLEEATKAYEEASKKFTEIANSSMGYNAAAAFAFASGESPAVTEARKAQEEAQRTVYDLRAKILDTYAEEASALAYTGQLEVAKLLYGEKSLEYKRLVADEERRNYEESVRSLDISETYIQALLRQYDRMVANKEEAEKVSGFVDKIFEGIDKASKIDLSNVFTKAMPAAQTLLDRVREIAGAYAEYGPSGVIPGTSIPRGKFTEDGMTAAARGIMNDRPSPFGKVAGGAAGYAKPTPSGGSARRETEIRKQIDLTKELTQAEKDRLSIVRSVESSLEDGFMAMVDGTSSVKDAFKSMARDIIKELYRVLVVQRMVGAISGAVNMFSLPSGPSTGTLGLPKFASGGSMLGGNAYLVGEHGPELVVPRHSGTVVNANQTANALGGGSGAITVQNNISVTGSDAAMVRAEVAKMIPQITNATKAAVIDAKQRGGQMAAAFR